MHVKALLRASLVGVCKCFYCCCCCCTRRLLVNFELWQRVICVSKNSFTRFALTNAVAVAVAFVVQLAGDSGAHSLILSSVLSTLKLLSCRPRCAMQQKRTHEKEIDNCKVSISTTTMTTTATTMSAQFASIQIFIDAPPPLSYWVALFSRPIKFQHVFDHCREKEIGRERQDQCSPCCPLNVCMYDIYTYVYTPLPWWDDGVGIAATCIHFFLLFFLPCARIVWLLSMPVVVSLYLCFFSFPFWQQQKLQFHHHLQRIYTYVHNCMNVSVCVCLCAWAKWIVRWGKVSAASSSSSPSPPPQTVTVAVL